MSVDATRWAWSVELNSSTKRLVLLSLADRAGEDHTCYPSTKRVVKDTCLDRKTILKAITEMIEDGLIFDTGERKGNGVRVLKLVGVLGRENDIYPKKLTDPKIGTGAEIGITTDPKNGTATDPNFGTQNLKGNLKENLTKTYGEKFEIFWNEYPSCKRKGTREAAYKTFKKYEKDFDAIIKVLNEFKKDDMWLKNNGEFIAAPSSWLNKQHWKADYWIEKISSNTQIEVEIEPKRPVVKMIKKNYLNRG